MGAGVWPQGRTLRRRLGLGRTREEAEPEGAGPKHLGGRRSSRGGRPEVGGAGKLLSRA